jgi:hypothetical protein
VYVVIRFWEPYTETGYTILIHGLIHILDYIRITILCYANIVMTAKDIIIGMSYITINIEVKYTVKLREKIELITIKGKT